MNLQRALETDASQPVRPFPLITATLVSYMFAIAMSAGIGNAGEVSPTATDAPTPYTVAHLAIVNQEPLPPTF